MAKEEKKAVAVQEKALAPLDAVKKEVVDVVEGRVAEFVKNGELNLPENYSPHNAMKSAWLTLQAVEDKDGKPALLNCTRASIANALLDMVVQGLNPAKKQGYFIVYKDKLVFQRSYFGTMAVCKNVAGAQDVRAEVVYEDDDFVYEIGRTGKIIRRHIQELKNIAPDKIQAAYCVIEFKDGRQYTEVMTMAQIKKAWEKSKAGAGKDGSVHKEYPEEMCKRTVINRACKAYINSSNDSNLLLHHFNRADDVVEDQEIEEEIAENANSLVIDIESNVTDGGEEQVTLDTEPDGQQTITGGPGF